MEDTTEMADEAIAMVHRLTEVVKESAERLRDSEAECAELHELYNHVTQLQVKGPNGAIPIHRSEAFHDVSYTVCDQRLVVTRYGMLLDAFAAAKKMAGIK